MAQVRFKGMRTSIGHEEDAAGLYLTSVLRNASGPLLVAVVFASLWYAFALLADSAVFPSPLESMSSLAGDFSEAHFRGSLFNSLMLLLLSYVACVVVGSVVGFAIGLLPFWRGALSPVLYGLYSIPKVTLYPLFLLFLGIGPISRFGFAFAHGVLPMVLIVMGATATIEPIQLKLGASLRLGPVQLFRHILAPAIMPSLATGMRLSFGLTFLGLILAEMFSGGTGLGYELLRNVTLVRVGGIAGQILLVAVIALVPTTMLRILERRVHARYEGNWHIDQGSSI